MSTEQDTSGTFMNDSHKVTLVAMVIMATTITLIPRNNGNSNTNNLGNHGNVSNICTILNINGMCQPTDGRIDMTKITSTFYKCI